MYRIPFDRAKEQAFDKVIHDPTRTVQIVARLYNKNGHMVGAPLIWLTGDLTLDWTNHMTEPSRTLNGTILDPHNQMVIDTRSVSTSSEHLSKQIDISYNVWLPYPDEHWVEVPMFRGPITHMEREGIEVNIDAAGRDSQHLGDYKFPHAFSVRKAMRIWQAIRAIFERRGETEFDFIHKPRRLSKHRTWGLGKSPWKAAQKLAKEIDCQLFCRGDGTFVLRELPTQATLILKEGSDSVVLEYPTESISLEGVFNLKVIRGEKNVKRQFTTTTELTDVAPSGTSSIKVDKAKDFKDNRKVLIYGGGGSGPEVHEVDPSYTEGNKTIPLKRNLSRRHGKGSKVEVKFTDEVAVAVIGRKSLPDHHPYSDKSLTGGGRPLVNIEDRPKIHKKKSAEDAADKELKQMVDGLHEEIHFVCAIDPRVDEMDVAKIDIGGIEKRTRLKQVNFSLDLDSPRMEVNWGGSTLPKRLRNKGKGKN